MDTRLYPGAWSSLTHSLGSFQSAVDPELTPSTCYSPLSGSQFPLVIHVVSGRRDPPNFPLSSDSGGSACSTSADSIRCRCGHLSKIREPECPWDSCWDDKGEYKQQPADSCHSVKPLSK